MAEAFEQEITTLFAAREQEHEARRLQSSLSPRSGPMVSEETSFKARGSFPSDGGADDQVTAPAHRLDESPAGYSLAGWSPPEPASASPTGLSIPQNSQAIE